MLLKLYIILLDNTLEDVRAYSFIDLVIETLKIVKKQLSQKEIWDNAV